MQRDEHSAVNPNSGKSVSHSDPGLRRPRPVPTAGRKPAARPLIAQAKSGQGAGQSPATERQREALASCSMPSGGRGADALDAFSPEQLGEHSLKQLLSFFQLLDSWEREPHAK
jgi:hypothetical protein